MVVEFMSLLTSPVALLMVTLTVLFLFLKSKRSSVSNLPPGPRGWEALYCVMTALRQGNLHIHAERWSQRYGELVLCRSILGDMCFLNSPRLVRKVFASKELEAFTNNRPATFTGWFLLRDYRDVVSSDTNKFPEWSKFRKMFHRAVKFYGEGVGRMENAIQTELQRLVKELETSSGQDVDMAQTISRSILCVVAVLISGEYYEPDSHYLRTIKKYDDLGNDMFSAATDTTLVIFPWLRFVPLLRYKSLCDETIAARKEIRSHFLTDAKKSHVSGKPRGFVNVMLDEQSKGENSWMSDDNIEAGLSNVIGAAFLTSENTLKAAFLYLTYNPEVMRRVQKEIDENIGERPPTLDDKTNLPFTEAVVLETLRHSSVVALGVPHETSDDVTVDNYVIPKGTMVFSNILALHHDPEVFPDPERFLPDRFLDDRGHLLPANHPVRQNLLPFGIGKRSCPGEAFARSRVFLYVSTLLQKFDVLPPKNHPLLPDARSSWNNGIVLDLQPHHVVFLPRT